jgi:hypothetical protein
MSRRARSASRSGFEPSVSKAAAAVVGGDLAVFDQHVVDREHDLTVARGPGARVGRLDDDVAVQAGVLRVVLADVRVVPVQPVVGEAHPVRERAADRDGLLGVVRHAVVAVLEPEAVPVHGRLDVGVVPDGHDDLGALLHA